VSRFNIVGYDVDSKWLAKKGPATRPEIHFFQSRASNDLTNANSVYHREEVAPCSSFLISMGGYPRSLMRGGGFLLCRLCCATNFQAIATGVQFWQCMRSNGDHVWIVESWFKATYKRAGSIRFTLANQRRLCWLIVPLLTGKETTGGPKEIEQTHGRTSQNEQNGTKARQQACSI